MELFTVTLVIYNHVNNKTIEIDISKINKNLSRDMVSRTMFKNIGIFIKKLLKIN